MFYQQSRKKDYDRKLQVDFERNQKSEGQSSTEFHKIEFETKSISTNWDERRTQF